MSTSIEAPKGTSWVVEGRVLAGQYPTDEMMKGIVGVGATIIVNMILEAELADLKLIGMDYVPFVREAEKKGHRIEIVHKFGLPDHSVSEVKMVGAAKYITDIVKNSSKVVYLHCFGGAGRTGVVTALVLGMAFKLNCKEALELTQEIYDRRRDHRKVPETPDQFKLVRKVIGSIAEKRGQTPNPTKATGTTESKKKTVYLVRHAESVENIRVRAAREVFGRIRMFRLPNSDQVKKTLSLLQMDNDADLSPNGNAMLEEMGALLKSEDFVKANAVDLIAHSPLIRAKKTCMAMFVTGTETKTPVVSLDALVEMTPLEYVTSRSAFRKRMGSFEAWLASRSESSIVVVGHSQYFRQLLGNSCSVRKFNNCDVWEYHWAGLGTWTEVNKKYSSKLAHDENAAKA